VLPFFSTFFAMYLLNWSQVISFLPNPATLLITSCNYSSVRLNFNWSEIRLNDAKSKTYLPYVSTKLNIDLLPPSEKGFPILYVISFISVSKSTHYPAMSLLIYSRVSKKSLYFLSKPSVRAVLRISEMSHCLRLSQ
jgi:hypothetical protein